MNRDEFGFPQFDDDGQDPVRYHDRRRRHATASGPGGPGRKARQLCGQIRELLALALAGAADDRLHDVQLAAVLPAPNAGRLLIVVRAYADAWLALLDARAWLRAEVAAGITRRHVPEFTFTNIDLGEPGMLDGQLAPASGTSGPIQLI